MQKVLITGSSSWIALHIVSELLKNNFFVKCSLRDLNKSTEINDIFANKFNNSNKIEYCKLDILKDHSFDDVMSDVQYVIHTAVPDPNKKYSYPSELIDLTVESTLRVLKYASKNNIKKVILTSSLATVAYGNNKDRSQFNAESWTNLNNINLNNYIVSKTLAEKKAWKFAENKNFELYSINPGFVIGPTLKNDLSGISIQKIEKILTKKTFVIPNRYVNYIDVRDLAKMHVKLLLLKNSPVKRFVAASKTPISFLKINEILKSNGYSVTTIIIPNIFIKLAGLFFKRFRQMSYLLNVKIDIDNSCTKNHLEWKERPVEESLLDMAKSITSNMNRKK